MNFRKGEHDECISWFMREEKLVKANDIVKLVNENSKLTKWCLKLPRLHGIYETKQWSMRMLKTHTNNYKAYFPINKETAWLLGLYLAEGSSCGRWIEFALNINETAYASKIVEVMNSLGYHAAVKQDKSRNTLKVRITSVALFELFTNKFKRGASNKEIPIDIFLHKDSNIVASFLRGYFDGDGHYIEKHGRIESVTVSLKLAHQLQLMVARLGYIAYLLLEKYTDRVVNNHKIQGGSYKYKFGCSCSDFLKFIGYKPKHKQKRRYAFVTDDAIYLPIKSVETGRTKSPVFYLTPDANMPLISNVVVCENKVA